MPFRVPPLDGLQEKLTGSWPPKGGTLNLGPALQRFQTSLASFSSSSDRLKAELQTHFSFVIFHLSSIIFSVPQMPPVKASSDLLDCGILFALAVGLHILVAQFYPIIYGGDTIIRLSNFPGILIAYQLPLLQVLVHAAMRWFYGPAAIWILMGIIAGFAATGLYALTRGITLSRSAGWVAGLLCLTHPFLLYYSMVPYQEPLLLAGIVWGFVYLFQLESRRTLMLSSVFFGIACFTRYEGWIAAAVAALFHVWQTRARGEKVSWRAAAQSVALFGWAPILWILWNRGLNPPGTYVLDAGFEWARLYRPYFIVKTFLWWTQPAVVLMIVAGFAWTWMEARLREDSRLLALVSFLVLFLAALVFSAHGIQPDPVRFVTEREAYTLIGLLMVWAGVGGSSMALRFRMFAGQKGFCRMISMTALILVAAYGLNSGIERVARANQDPALRTDYEVARFLAGKQSRALVLAKPLPEDQVLDYLRRAEKAGGQEGRMRAQKLLSEVERTPFDYQRVLVYSWMGKEKIVSGDRLQGLDRAGVERFLEDRQIEYLVLFADFSPVREDERATLSLCVEGRAPVEEITHGEKQARIYRVR